MQAWFMTFYSEYNSFEGLAYKLDWPAYTETITYADSIWGRVFTGVCLSVCLSARYFQYSCSEDNQT